jgi:hypothetical protein
VAAAVCWPAVASAHGGPAILELSTDRTSPGGTIEARGDLGWGERIEFRLVPSDGQGIVLGVLTELEEPGHFDAWLTIPAQTAAGAYEVEAGNGELAVRSAVQVAGSPIGDDGGDADTRDRHGPTAAVIAVLPSIRTAAAPTASDTAPTVVRGEVQPGVIGAVVVVSAVILLIAGSRLRRRPAP